MLESLKISTTMPILNLFVLHFAKKGLEVKKSEQKLLNLPPKVTTVRTTFDNKIVLIILKAILSNSILFGCLLHISMLVVA